MERFFEKIKGDPALKAKYEAVLKKHEAAKDRDAVAAELVGLARAEGFDATPDGILSAFAPKGEISEEELEAVSGGGSAMALCAYQVSRNNYPDKKGPALHIPGAPEHQYHSLCYHSGDFRCTWFLCCCHGTDRCVDGYHECDKYGNSWIGRC
jgi:predicted ribosomally synthesized peptide with nif11-like leader